MILVKLIVRKMIINTKIQIFRMIKNSVKLIVDLKNGQLQRVSN